LATHPDGGTLGDVIVVGLDGSKSSHDAFAWALAEARIRADVVRVVCAWHVAPAAYGTVGFVPPVDRESFQRAAQDAVAETVDSFAESIDGVGVERLIVEGAPAEVLIEQAKDADLLVVGSRGHGTLSGLLLGSVGSQCAHHAPCPVVIVRDGRTFVRTP
jgi:nucleotide-binding universal stress UspA family protein